MSERREARLGAVQETLFIPLAGRARETGKRHPILRDPRAAELVASIDFDPAKYGRGAGGLVSVLRTAILDLWVRQFLAAHQGATVVEIGTGLNTRFERVDDGAVRWIDLDLPDTIDLRRQFFTDTARRRMVTASVTDQAWLDAVRGYPPPYFFVAEGVLPYLSEKEATGALARIAAAFPGAYLALDTYSRTTLEQQHRLAAKRNLARWGWSCDDPRSLERLGLRVLESSTVTRPPRALRASLPAAYRYLLPLTDPILGRAVRLTLFQAVSQPV